MNDAIWSQALMVFVAGFTGVFLSIVLLMLCVMAMSIFTGNKKPTAKTARKEDQANG